MNTESFVMYESVFKQFDRLDKRLGNKIANNFIRAIMEYGLYGVVPEEDNEIWLYGFEQAITSIEAAKSRRSKNTIDGSKGGRPREINEKEVLELKEQGLTNKEIANVLGCSESSIEKINRKNRNNLNDNVNANINANTNEKVNVECEEHEQPFIY